MLQFLRPAPQAPVADPRLAEPTPTLRLLAGEHAERVARLWPPPHGAYLEMPAQRRHLTHVVLATTAAPRDALARALVGTRADAVARDYLGSTPVGFVRALGRLGELAWPGDDYLLLLSLFDQERAGAVLRQASALTPDSVFALRLLPPQLRVAAIARHVATPAQARLLDDAWSALACARGPDAGQAAVLRWSRATDVSRLFAMAAEEFDPERFDLAAFPVHADLRRLDGTTALAESGRRFCNCLATYRDRAADGAIALYEWAGPPPAAVALQRDAFFGWRLEEARGVANALLDEDARERLIALLEAEGVRVGWASRDLAARLQRVAGIDHVWIDDLETRLGAFGP